MKLYTSRKTSCLKCVRIFEYLEDRWGFVIDDHLEDAVLPMAQGVVLVNDEMEVVEVYDTPDSIVRVLMDHGIAENFDLDFNYTLDFIKWSSPDSVQSFKN